MLLNTFPFLIFFLIVFLLYWKIPKKYQWILLLLAGYYFFGSWKPAYLGIIIITTLINYFAAIRIGIAKKQKRRWLLLALIFDLTVLFIFKYFNFFAFTLQTFIAIKLPQFNLLLPIGISFYTFQTIGYLVDVYRGKIKPEKHLGIFALFVCFFPQLSAGPIERASELMPQLKNPPTFKSENVVSGLKLFTFGLFKKMVIADNLAIIVDRVFNTLPNYKGLSLIIAVMLYSWQIYTDFSGYTDMSRGVARMLGFNLVLNFNLPYLSTSVTDFWRRWHMSLSRWFKDYIYIPLGGNRNGLVRTCINVLIVFTLCGLWHGASWNFVIWGFFHGFIMTLERIIKKLNNNRIRIPNPVKIMYAYILICISWIFFRTNNLADAFYVFKYSLVGLKSFIIPKYIWATVSQLYITNQIEMIITFGLLIMAILLEVISSRTSLYKLLGKQPAIIRYSIYTIIIFMIIELRNIDIKSFIYVRF
jgi:alginate O-acetyltransferase complex protein AlgI